MSDVGKILIQIVREKAAARPDYVYAYPTGTETCMYVHDGKPSCLIGQVLWDAGLIDASLEDGPYNTETSSALIQGKLGLELESKELAWLRNVQSQQDVGEQWADAVVYADRRPSYEADDAA